MGQQVIGQIGRRGEARERDCDYCVSRYRPGHGTLRSAVMHDEHAT